MSAFVVFGTDGRDDFVWVESGMPWIHESEEGAKFVAAGLRFENMAVNIKVLESL